MGRIRRTNSPRSGITLIELLVVMVIAAIIGGMTIASFAAIGRRSSREGAAQDIEGLLRQARISAVDSGRGALVRINPLERSLYGLSSTIEGAWHFEEITGGFTPGSKGYDGALNGGPTIQDGAIGLCLGFGGNDWVDCGSPPVFNQTDGVRLEAWIRPEGTGTMGVMGKRAAANEGFGVGLTDNGNDFTVNAGFVVLDTITNAALDVRLESATTIQANEWTHVAIEYDGYEARLFLNGVLADLDSYRADEAADGNPIDDPNPVPALPGLAGTDEEFGTGSPLMPSRSTTLEFGRAWQPFPLPAGYRNFTGRIDEPKLLSIAGGKRVQMPEGVGLVASDEVIHFDGQGRLDIAYHATDVFVGVGDPYQAATLDTDITAGDLAITLRPANPMPPTGGVVLIGRELIHYDTVTGLQLDLSDAADRGVYGTIAQGQYVGAPVQFARIVQVTPAGVVRRVETGP